MTWTVPEVSRTEPPLIAAGEREALETWLDYHRETLLFKCQGLTAEQLAARPLPPSTLSLLGLVRHMAEVERCWFRIRFAGLGLPDLYCNDEHPDGDLDFGTAASAEADVAAFASECEQSRRTAASRGLDETFVHERWGGTIDLRWVYIHMIEEYARHNGHADLLREVTDGVTGD